MIGQAEAKEQVAAGAMKREWGVGSGVWGVGRDYTSAVEGGGGDAVHGKKNPIVNSSANYHVAKWTDI